MTSFSDLLPNPGGKEIYRLHAKKLREEAHQRQPHAARHAAARFMASIPLDSAKCVAVYYPAGTELHTYPLVDALRAEGVTVCLPVVVGSSKPLLFRKYCPDTALEPGPYGIMAPSDTSPSCVPDILTVPLLGFRRDGARLGMGGGFYDRTLAALRRERRTVAVGYAYSAQEMQQFPVERHDQMLNWIVTEQDAWKIR